MPLENELHSEEESVDVPLNTTQKPSFETGLSQLSDIVSRLESGGLGLSESITAYEQGVAILRRLHDELSHAEQRVSVLTRVDEEGQPILDPFVIGPLARQTADAAHVSADKGGAEQQRSESSLTRSSSGSAARSVGKTSRSKRLPGMDDGSGSV
ncbi:MAG: exodeoxyribonuclease VII small subunit [Planctomycetota bacterium]